ncbi:MAG: LacI family transcriptional regulator [Chloroflexi bacterium]|nr:MAG: LacI family transcriptional regulator [Chloroflexota bacterium]
MNGKGQPPKSGDKVTIFDVARESGVSYSTVSRVLNGFKYVKESTRQKVLEAADRLGYVANLQARSLAGGRSNIIGVLVPGLDNGYIGEIIRGIDEALRDIGYDLMLYTTHRQEGKESRYVQAIANGLTDGLILIVPLIPTAYLDALRQQRFPYVLIDQSDIEESSSIVDATNEKGAYEATRYLIELGHRRIGHITGLMGLSSAVERLAGYKAALEEAGIPFNPQLVVEGDFWEQSGYEGTQKLLALPQPPTAIFASNDLMAFGAYEAVRTNGLDIPKDISIVGFDDIPQASLVHPKLTTVHQPLDQMGRVAVQILLERIEKDSPPRRVTLAIHLVIRDSCQPLKT